MCHTRVITTRGSRRLTHVRLFMGTAYVRINIDEDDRKTETIKDYRMIGSLALAMAAASVQECTFVRVYLCIRLCGDNP